VSVNSFQVSDQIANDFEKRLAKVVSDFQKRIISALSSLETINGKAIKSQFNIDYATALYPQLLRDLREAGFDDVVNQLVNTDSGKLIRSLKANTGVPLQFTMSSVQTMTALQSAKFADFKELSEQAISRIRREVTNTVLTGSPIEKALSSISDSLETQFKKYAYTYANTALRDTMQLSIDLGVAQAKADGVEIFWEYTGPDDDKTRDACIELLNIQYFTDSEREEWDSATADERAYNCRHAFVPISREAYEESEGLGKP